MEIPRKGWKTYTIGSVVAAVGTLFALIQGVDWSILFKPETAVAVGAGITFGRAIVAVFQAAGKAKSDVG